MKKIFQLNRLITTFDTQQLLNDQKIDFNTNRILIQVNMSTMLNFITYVKIMLEI